MGAIVGSVGGEVPGGCCVGRFWAGADPCVPGWWLSGRRCSVGAQHVAVRPVKIRRWTDLRRAFAACRRLAMCVHPISVRCVRVGIGPKHVPPTPLSPTGIPRRAIDVAYTASRGQPHLLTPAVRWVSGRRPIYAALRARTDRQRDPGLAGAATTCPLLL
jgi:hypothetical protein